MFKKSLISLLAFGMLISGGNVAQAVGIGMDVSQVNERNAPCLVGPGANLSVLHNAYVRWTPTGANAGLILRGARVIAVGGHAQWVNGFSWVRVTIQNNPGHNGWAGNTMWVATSQLQHISIGCR